jgi:ElaB/YqjD/DUF883 family membrane-anchored ribosome-binding protein
MMNTRTSPNSDDPEDLERNGENIRADMDETLEALQEKLSPSRAMDRSMQFLREHGGEISREITSAVREHPVPLLLTAVGLTWFTASIIRSRSNAGSYESFDYESSDSSEYDYDYGYEEESELSGQGLRGRARQIKRKASDKLHTAMDSARGRTREATSQLNGLIREQPLALGALALAAGAILGAVLPATDYERQTVKPLRDRALARAEEVGQRSYDKVRSALRSDGDEQSRGAQSSTT